jgi:CRISPR-associated Csx3 family protein
MVKVRIEIDAQAESAEFTMTKDNEMRFSTAKLPSGAEVTARAINAGLGVVIMHYEFTGMLSPSDIKPLETYTVNRLKAVLKEFRNMKLLVISGRMPIWAYMAVGHAVLHLVPALATLDPKLKSAVVVADHSRKFDEGEVVEIPSDIIAELLS